ncbi:hypothetical protein [Ralstonia edaphi]|uniref:hypothetical protein n=1 Tax=Ralstonia edaphi TaxID=3058599 RepID=UPI00292FA806|nr:hypothetical protein [Ralstonia sp. LMG 6871]
MQKALRGDDSPAILILSININSPVATWRRQGFPEFDETSLAGRRGRMRGADTAGTTPETGGGAPRTYVDRNNQY